MNLRQGYKNVRIKEENEWKIAFSTLENVYKPIVILFGLTNSLVTFQAMMIHLLRDMIKTEDKDRRCIDDVMVGMETEEGYNNIVEEVSRRIVKNDLFVKPEKYV